MKSKKKIVLTLVCSIVAILIIVTGFALANANGSSGNIENIYESNYSPTGDRTFVRLERTANDKVDVYLEMADTTVMDGTEQVKTGVSVASFQIGLEIEVDLEKDENSAINFEFDDSLSNTDETYCKLRKTTTIPLTKTYSSSEGTEETITENIGEILHIYYVGTKELNDSNKLEGIKIGTISFDNFEEEETISITPEREFTKIASNSHNETEITILPEDSLSELIINPQDTNNPPPADENKPENTPTPTPDNPGKPTETPTPKPEPTPTPEVTPTPDNSQNGQDEPTETPTPTPDNSQDGQDEPTETPTPMPDDSQNGQGSSTTTPAPEKNNSPIPKTGDIAIKLFVTLMIVSLIGIVTVLIIKKHRK